MSKTQFLATVAFLSGALLAGLLIFGFLRFSIDASSQLHTESLMLATANNVEAYVAILKDLKREDVQSAETRMEHLLDGELLMFLGADQVSEGTRKALMAARHQAREYRREFPSPATDPHVLEALKQALDADGGL